MSDETILSVSHLTIARKWARLGITGFGGPPAHISMLRAMCVDTGGWISRQEFDDAVAATGLLPGPASTQLAIWCAWRLRGWSGGLVGGLCFICPGLAVIIALAAVFLAPHPSRFLLGAAAGAGAAVPVVALAAARDLIPASWKRLNGSRAREVRWLIYVALGATAAWGPWVVLALLGCGVCEIACVSRTRLDNTAVGLFPLPLLSVAAVGGLSSLVWVAFKVGALSYGGGFVIIPLMQHDAVSTYHWMTGAQFLNAVALGQLTPGPVVQTVSVVGYAADKVTGALVAASVAFGPSFLFVFALAPRFDRLRHSPVIQGFLIGAGAATIGAIAGSALSLGSELSHLWQLLVLGAGLVAMFCAKRSTVVVLVGAAACGVLAVWCGAQA